MEPTKPFYQSLTFWFNILFVIASVAGLFGFADYKPSADVTEIAAVILAVVNLCLRLRQKVQPRLTLR